MVLSLLRHATRRCLAVTHISRERAPIYSHLCRRYPLNLLEKGFDNRAILRLRSISIINIQLLYTGTINIIIYRKTVNVQSTDMNENSFDVINKSAI